MPAFHAPTDQRTDKTVAVFIAPGLEEVEALATVDILFRAGIPTTMISVTPERAVVSSHNIVVTCDLALAEADLELRSEGNVLGAAQSGRRSDLDLVRVTRDRDVIERARGEAEAVIAADPQLREHRALAAAIAQRLDEEAQAFLERS